MALAASKDEELVPEFLRTHPSNETRRAALSASLPGWLKFREERAACPRLVSPDPNLRFEEYVAEYQKEYQRALEEIRAQQKKGHDERVVIVSV